MTNRETMELFIEKNGQETVAYPFVEKDHVVFGNGMGIEDVIEQDVTMPTVTHEEVSFKVGVGDQDVSSSVVDSSAGEMTIKGKTYQNILPEPSTHVLTNNKEMFKVNEGLDPNVEIVDGVSKSAILKGQTLVNLCKDSWWNGSLTNGYDITQPLKPNNKYIIFVNSINNIAEINLAKSDFTPIVYSTNNNDNYFIFTTPDSTSELTKVRIVLSEVPSSEPHYEAILLEYQEGIENWNIPYFEGMQSVKLPVLTTTGKNLFNTDGKEIFCDANYQIQNNEIIVHSTSVGWHKCDIKYFNLTPNTSFKLSYKSEVLDGNPHEQVIIQDSQANGIYNNITPSDGKLVLKFYCGNDTKYGKIRYYDIQLEENSVVTTYEPYKSNILTTPEDLELRGIGDVKDTLDLTTGKKVECIGEVILDGSENWVEYNSFPSDYPTEPKTIKLMCNISNKKSREISSVSYLKSSEFKVVSADSNFSKDEESICERLKVIRVAIEREKLKTQDINGFKEWLSQNPITVQYELDTKSIKTVDLSSSGNWEKIVFNGSENWSVYPRSSSVNFVNTIAFQTNTIPNAISTENYQLFSESFRTTSHYASDVEGIFMKGTMRLSIKKSKLMSQDVDGLKQYLQQNPLTVWYQTVVHQDSTQVKQPIFFKDGHIQLSSGADNSLIPTLDYQAKTSNSYVMDLMKTNTRYTMKAKSASGTFTIDGTSYGAGTNGTFTTPSSMTNKLLVMSDKTHEEVMIIEGDVTDKTIPYFKGIKSAFEGEDKIEVLSTGKNLWTGADNYINNGANIIIHDENQCVFEHHVVNNGIRVKVSDYEYQTITISYDFEILDGKALNVGGHNRHETIAYYIDGINVGTNYHNGHVTTYEKNRVYHVDHVVHINLPISEGPNNDREHIGIEPNRYSADTPTYCKMRVTNFQITLGNVIQEYEPRKSNSTKIPLLSPLRSLPNGVCDELIIDRMKKKATLIQRVGHSVINSEFAKNGGKWGNTKDTDPCWGFHCGNYVQGSFKLNEHNSINDKLPIKEMATTGDPLMGYYQSNPHIALRREEVCDMKMALNWLDRNPINFYYQLETPVITEVDLEGFPYIYKDGHIFLNSEIAPTTQIIYSISQQHQISASTQDLIRHEQELVYLYKLIAQYIQVDYQSTLLSLDLKLK